MFRLHNNNIKKVSRCKTGVGKQQSPSGENNYGRVSSHQSSSVRELRCGRHPRCEDGCGDPC